MKKVLITGASGGIGLEVARVLATKKYQVTILARSEDKLKAALLSLAGEGHSILVADLTNKEDLDRVASHITNVRYEVLINNAGAGMYGKFIEMSIEDQMKNMYLNMGVLVSLSHTFLKGAKSGDALVNVASILAHSSLPGASVYAGTKAFVSNFSESLWYEFKGKGIYVMSFNPGATKSDFHANAGGHSNSFSEAILSTPQDVAKELVAALKKRKKARVVQGWKNRFMLFGFKFLSRNGAVQVMGGISPGMKG